MRVFKAVTCGLPTLQGVQIRIDVHGSVHVLQATAIREATTEPALRNDNALVDICLSGDRYCSANCWHTYLRCVSLILLLYLTPNCARPLAKVHTGPAYCYCIYS
jgi:hypothetical protein